MKPLRIAMVSYYMPSESKLGTGHQVHALANALADRGHEITVFTRCRPSAGALYSTQTVGVEGSLRTFKFASHLRRMDWSDFDVLHAHSSDFLLSGKTKPPHVRTVHGSSLREAIHIRGPRARVVMLYYAGCEITATVIADTSVAVSRNTQAWLPWVRTRIPNGVDLSRFSPGEKSSNPSILFVGTYFQRKRGWLLADVFERDILSRVPDAELWLVSEDAPARPGMTIFPRLPEADLQDLYRRAWVFCLPSTYEGFGIPYIEAMASGTPVVATRNAGAIEVTENGRYGAIVADDGLPDALLALLQSSSARGRLAADALRHVQKYSLASVAESYESLYFRLVGSSRGAARSGP
jgi:glycosyltransferase involved in cell wall biosynthesis